MLYLLFQLDGGRCVLSVAQAAEVLPLAATKLVPGTPAWVTGVIERYGAPMPVINVPQLTLGRPARPLRSARLVLMRYEAGIRDDDAPLLGSVLEHATRTQRIDDASFAASGVATPNVRWLDPVASLDNDLVQRVDTETMLGAYVRALLFPAAVD